MKNSEVFNQKTEETSEPISGDAEIPEHPTEQKRQYTIEQFNPYALHAKKEWNETILPRLQEIQASAEFPEEGKHNPEWMTAMFLGIEDENKRGMGSVALLLRDAKTNQIIGYSYAVSEAALRETNDFYDERLQGIAHHTAIVIDKPFRNQQLVWQLIDYQQEALADRGYKFMVGEYMANVKVVDGSHPVRRGFGIHVAENYDNVIYYRPLDTLYGNQEQVLFDLRRPPHILLVRTPPKPQISA